ncbi:DUF4126 family protein [Pseudomonas sp. NA-150]|uniref:DUF4126 family protein n=1 Tax=Pseudomonas sp. NA-150 TaxID=3367525 RepID=UPI0037C7712A
MSIYVIALVIGVVAGLRVFTAPAVVAWAAHTGALALGQGWASFMASAWTPYVFSVLAAVEFVTDQLPKTPSRKVPQQFIPRLVSGGFSGAVIGASTGSTVAGLVLGVVGAVIGTFVGYELRAKGAKAMGKDWPIAVLEDVIAVMLAVLAVSAV